MHAEGVHGPTTPPHSTARRLIAMYAPPRPLTRSGAGQVRSRAHACSDPRQCSLRRSRRGALKKRLYIMRAATPRAGGCCQALASPPAPVFSPDTYIPRRLCLGHRGFNLGCRRQPPCRGESLLLTFSTRTYYCHWQVGRGHPLARGPAVSLAHWTTLPAAVIKPAPRSRMAPDRTARGDVLI